MGTTIRRAAAALGVAALVATGAAVSQASALTATAPAGTADDAVRSTLTLMREEERMSRDLYAALADVHDGARPFSMVTNAEDRHFDAVGVLLERYGVADPSAGRSAGSYADPAVQRLYDGWLAKGRTSLAAAYAVGVEVEKRDIADLDKAVAGTLPADVDDVLGRLLQGSRNHLAAYERAVSGDLGTGAGTMGGGNGGGPGSHRGNGMGGRGMMGNGTPGQGPGAGGTCPYLGGDAT